MTSKQDSELCAWNYSRQSYGVIFHGDDKLAATITYYFPGTTPQVNNIKELTSKFNTEVKEHEILTLEDDDSVMTMVQKMSVITMYKTEYLYFWIQTEPESDEVNATNMQFDLIYNIDVNTARRFTYDPIPGKKFTEIIGSIADWQDGLKVVTQKFDNSFLNSFTYPKINGVNIIHCMPIDAYVSYLEAKEAQAIRFNVKTYFPEIDIRNPIVIDQIIIGRPNTLKTLKYTNKDPTYEKIKSTVINRNNSVQAINSRQFSEEIRESKDIAFYDCNILEAVVHINYRESNDNFVDLEKVFHMFPLSNDIPFSRLKMDKDTNYMIYKEATNNKSENYIDKRIIQDWIDPKLNKLFDANDVYAVSSLNYNRNIGRGLSFKIFNYGDKTSKKYMTLNIYKDGKIELKCFWDELFNSGNEYNPGGNKALLIGAVNKVRKFITELNNLNYHNFGSSSSKTKITIPDDHPFTPDSNIRIAFFNTISVFDFGKDLDYSAFIEYLDNYRSYVHLVTRKLPNNEIDTRSIELRYKRIHNYIQLKNIQRFIKNYKTENDNNYDPADLRNNVMVTFSLTKEDAITVIADYEAVFENKRKRSRRLVSKDDIGAILNRDISTQSGIDIKIIKRNQKSLSDNTYKCLILGISYEMLGPIYNFLSHVIYYYKHHNRLSKIHMQPVNYLEYLDNVKDTSDKETIENSNKLIVAEVTGSKRNQKSISIPASIGATELDTTDIGFDFDDEDIDQGEEGEEGEGEDGEGEDGDDGDDGEPVKKPVETLPVKATKVVTTTVRSLLDFLKERVPEAYADSVPVTGNKPYSTVCQKNAGRQPLVIPVEFKNSLFTYVKDKVAKLEAEYKAKPTNQVRTMLHEYKIHLTTLLNGVEYRPKNASQAFFYFCPLSWKMDATDVQSAFPAYDMAPDPPNLTAQEKRERENVKKNLHMIPSDKFRTKYKKQYNSWDQLLDEQPDKFGRPPHSTHIRFIQHTADFGACQACCYADPAAKSDEKQAKCLGQATMPLSSAVSTTAASYIKAEGKFVEENRFAFIPDKLNRIFNFNDDGRKIISGNISAGFDYYLRKGTKEGKFINAMHELSPKIEDIVEHIAEVLREDNEIYKALKKGAINQIFMPEADVEGSNLSERERTMDTIISLNRFIEFLKTNTNDINEDFLWDLLSRPGVLLPKGINIIICEVQITSKRTNEIDLGIVKCPVGYEIDDLYSSDRHSIILYRYKDIYEIICHVEEKNRNIVYNPLFEPGHPLITDIINHIGTKCMTFPNIKAEQELLKHMSIQKDSIVNSALGQRTALIDVHEIMQMLMVANISLYLNKMVDYVQILDSHNKVTHIRLSADHWIPVKPSGIIDGVPAMHINNIEVGELPECIAMVKLMEQLTTYENFIGYKPYAFLLDPGSNLDDPEDDSIIGIMLSNSLICYTRPVLVSDVEKHPKLTINHPNKELEVTLKSYEYDINKLLFNQTELWYDDYKKADKALSKQDDKIVDMRRIYSVRSSFEHESYQRLRYEIAQLLATKHKPQRDELLEIIQRIPSKGTIDGKIRDTVHKILDTILTGYIANDTDINLKKVNDMIGPLDRSTMDTMDTMDTYSYSYNTPSIRYECFNRTLDKYRDKDDIHCQNGKLFIPSMNLITGQDNNLQNYISRITEDILRIPIKRKEILEGQMSNFISNIVNMPANAYLLGSANMVEDFKKMYTANVNYKTRMNTHYDVINPQNYTEYDYNEDQRAQLATGQDCVGKYVNMPEYWIKQFASPRPHWKIYDIITNSNSCIYKELDNIIGLKHDNIKVNCRNKIASLINSDEFKGVPGRDGWQLALDYYSHSWRSDYSKIKTKEEFLDAIRNSTKHGLTIFDLSLISRGYDVKFIVLARPNTLAPKGIVCLNTTQTKSDDIIILYLQGLSNYSVVKNTSISPEQGIFKISDLPQFLQKEWVSTCINDNKDVIDAPNHLYIGAPIRSTDPKTGRIIYKNAAGTTVENPNFRRIKMPVPTKEPTAAQEAVAAKDKEVTDVQVATKEPETTDVQVAAKQPEKTATDVQVQVAEKDKPQPQIQPQPPVAVKKYKYPMPRVPQVQVQPPIPIQPPVQIQPPVPIQPPVQVQVQVQPPASQEATQTRIPTIVKLTLKPKVPKS